MSGADGGTQSGSRDPERVRPPRDSRWTNGPPADRRSMRQQRSRASDCFESAILFHVKHGRGSTDSSSCCCAGSSTPIWSPPRRSRRSGPAMSPTRCSSSHLAPDASDWVDLGSGGGFPGLVIACALAGCRRREGAPGREQSEESRPSCASASRALGLPAIVHAQRIEDFAGEQADAFDVVTARALAPLDKLLGYANPLLKRGARRAVSEGTRCRG